MRRLVTAGRDPRYGGVTSLTTAATIAFVLFLSESVTFKLVFAATLAAAFASINLVTIAAVLPLSSVQPDAARKSRAILVSMSVVLICGSIFGAAIR